MAGETNSSFNLRNYRGANAQKVINTRRLIGNDTEPIRTEAAEAGKVAGVRPLGKFGL